MYIDKMVVSYVQFGTSLLQKVRLVEKSARKIPLSELNIHIAGA